MFLALCPALALASEPSLQFKSNGELKILQLTDMHLRPDMPQEVVKTMDRMDYMVRMESPDYIVLTGDFIWGTPARPVLKSLLDRLDSYGIPYSLVYGNHDREQDIPVGEMSSMISEAKGSINPLAGNGTLADFRLPVLASDGSGKEMADLYLMDSNDYTLIKAAGRYGYFRPEQVSWLRSECEAATARNAGKNVPSLAFFHIPLPEYKNAWDLKRYGTIGIKGEETASPELNTGMFEAMRSSGNVFGVFCGHDHNNNFIANFCKIALAYGQYCGDNVVYNDLHHGARVIVLYEGQRRFRTWIREDEARISFDTVYDGEHLELMKDQVIARAVPEFKDDFVWENSLVCCRAYGAAMESETLSPGFDVWSKIPGRLVTNDWYSHMTASEGDKIYYHHAPDGKDCYKVGKSLGAGTSLPVIDGKLQFPATNWRECRIVEKKTRKIVFELIYPEWEGDKGVRFSLVRRVSLYANSYFFKVKDTYMVSGDAPVKLAIGIRSADTISGAPKKGWPKYVTGDRMAFWTAATDQSVEKEEAMLGTAVIIKDADAKVRLTSDKKNWIMEVPLENGKPVTYWTGNCWSKGEVFTSSEEWFDFVASFPVNDF